MLFPAHSFFGGTKIIEYFESANLKHRNSARRAVPNVITNYIHVATPQAENDNKGYKQFKFQEVKQQYPELENQTFNSLVFSFYNGRAGSEFITQLWFLTVLCHCSAEVDDNQKIFTKGPSIERTKYQSYSDATDQRENLVTSQISENVIRK